MPKLESHSGATVLYYTGPGTSHDVPAADLSANALARIAWVRAGAKRPASPADIKEAAIAAIRDELIATGNYAAKASTEEPPGE